MIGDSGLAADDLVLRDALVEHYAAHGLPANGGADAPWFHVQLGSISLRLPNPPARRRALLLHDVNHIAIVWLINLWGLALGVFCAPRAVFAAYVRGRRSGSIYHHSLMAKQLAATTVGEVRDRLRLKNVVGSPHLSDYFAFAFWCLVGLASLVVPTVVVLTALWLGVRAVARS